MVASGGRFEWGPEEATLTFKSFHARAKALHMLDC